MPFVKDLTKITITKVDICAVTVAVNAIIL